MGDIERTYRAEKMLNTLLIRADASPRIGTGHVMRCLALAQEWITQGGAVRVVSASITPALVQRLGKEGIPVTHIDGAPGSTADAAATAEHRMKHDGTWVVVDGYQFDGTYQSMLKEEGARMLFLDDYGHCEAYTADLVLNQNIDANPDWYRSRSNPEETRLLMGTRFALLRKEFWSWRSPRRILRDHARRLLVTLGGGDPDNVMATVIQAIEMLALNGQTPPDLSVTLVVGGSSLHYDAICKAVEYANTSIQAHRNQPEAEALPIMLRHDVTEMAALMAEHDLAISAGGSTCWELAFMGLPNAIVVLAENQRGIAKGLDEAGVSVNLGWHADLTAYDLKEALANLLGSDKKRIKMAQAAQHLVDGQGVRRVIDAVQPSYGGYYDNTSNAAETSMGSSDTNEKATSRKGLTLRAVQESDCRRLWEWANDAEVRKQSYNTGEIPWESHKEWFHRKRTSETCTIYIAEFEGSPVGQIRFDMEEKGAKVGVATAPDHRGQGHGTLLIQKGTEQFAKEVSSPIVIHAYIKKDNRVSVRAFEKCGYQIHKEENVKGVLSYHLVYTVDCA